MQVLGHKNKEVNIYPEEDAYILLHEWAKTKYKIQEATSWQAQLFNGGSSAQCNFLSSEPAPAVEASMKVDGHEMISMMGIDTIDRKALRRWADIQFFFRKHIWRISTWGNHLRKKKSLNDFLDFLDFRPTFQPLCCPFAALHLRHIGIARLCLTENICISLARNFRLLCSTDTRNDRDNSSTECLWWELMKSCYENPM